MLLKTPTERTLIFFIESAMQGVMQQMDSIRLCQLKRFCTVASSLHREKTCMIWVNWYT